jgi:hypothetical protein
MVTRCSPTAAGALLLAVALAACSSSNNAPIASVDGAALTCSAVDAGSTCPADAAPTYEASVQGIIAKSCLPACHDGSPDAAWPLTEEDDVAAWNSFVASDLIRCTMPPAGSTLTISDGDRRTILTWILCGNP